MKFYPTHCTLKLRGKKNHSVIKYSKEEHGRSSKIFKSYTTLNLFSQLSVEITLCVLMDTPAFPADSKEGLKVIFPMEPSSNMRVAAKY